jgi:hypothetical protein
MKEIVILTMAVNTIFLIPAIWLLYREWKRRKKGCSANL